MRKTITIATLALSLGAQAQNDYVKQYFYTSGGNFGTPGNKVTIGVIKDKKVKIVDTVLGDFSNTVAIRRIGKSLVYEGIAHVGRGASNDVLVRYDLDTYNRKDSINTGGVTAIATTDQKLVVVKGYGGKGANVDIYNINDLSLSSSVDDIKNYCTDVKIIGDSAFVSHNLPTKKVSWIDSIGYLSIISISQSKLVNTINLGTKAAGLKNLVISKEEDGRLHVYYTNFKDSVYQTVDNLTIHGIKNTQTAAVTNEYIYGIQKTRPFLTTIKTNKELNTTDTLHTKSSGSDFAGCVYDTTNHLYVILKTDYGSYGKILLYDAEKTLAVDSFSVGIAATALAIDYRKGTITHLNNGSTPFIGHVYPNPCQDVLHLASDAQGTWEITGTDGTLLATGQTMAQQTPISTAHLSKGIYLLSFQTAGGISSLKFVKE